jgi:hypothetical protein
MNSLPLLSPFLLLLIHVIGKVDLNPKLIPKFVHACALCPDNAPYEFPVDIELGRL